MDEYAATREEAEVAGAGPDGSGYGNRPRIEGFGVTGAGSNSVSVEDGTARISLATRDADIVAALGEVLADGDGSAAVDYVQSALRVGVIALRQARPTVDERSLRNAGEQLVAELRAAVDAQSATVRQLLETQVEKGLRQSLAEYFDPKSGRFATRADALTGLQEKLQKELPASIAEQIRLASEQQFSGDSSKLAATIARQVGADSQFVRMFDPARKDGVIATIEASVKRLLDEQRNTVLDQFSLDKEGSAIKRLLTGVSEISKGLRDEFSLNNDAGALKRLNDQLTGALAQTREQINQHLDMNQDSSALRRIKKELDEQLAALAKSQREFAEREAEESRKFQAEVRQVLNEFTARREERARSTGGGLDFEQALFARLQELSGPGEIVEFVGNSANGVIPNSKKGDIILIMDEDSTADFDGTCGRIVFEAKQDASYTPVKSVNEIREAITNRKAHVGVFVMSRETAVAAQWHRRFERQGNDILVQWHPDAPETQPYLEAAVLLARSMVLHLAQPESEAPEADWDVVDKAMAELDKQLERFEGIRAKCDSIKSAAGFIDEEARKMADKIEKSLTRLSDQLDALRSGDGGDSE